MKMFIEIEKKKMKFVHFWLFGVCFFHILLFQPLAKPWLQLCKRNTNQMVSKPIDWLKPTPTDHFVFLLILCVSHLFIHLYADTGGRLLISLIFPDNVMSSVYGFHFSFIADVFR